MYYSFTGVTGQELQGVLHDLIPLRRQFYEELRNNPEEADDFIKSNPKAFYIYNDCVYMLGKFEEIILPVKNSMNQGTTVPILLLSELFVSPELRGHGIGSALVTELKNLSISMNTPIILGCNNDLEEYYSQLGFSTIESFTNKSCKMMLFFFNNSEIQERLNDYFTISIET